MISPCRGSRQSRFSQRARETDLQFAPPVCAFVEGYRASRYVLLSNLGIRKARRIRALRYGESFDRALNSSVHNWVAAHGATDKTPNLRFEAHYSSPRMGKSL